MREIGLNLGNGVRVNLGDSLENLLVQLKKNRVDYKIPYKSEVADNVDMVILVEKCGVELNVQNDKVIFIKSSNTDSNYVLQFEEGKSAVHTLKEIKQKLADTFGIESSDIRTDKFDVKSFNATLSIPITETLKAKIELITGVYNKVYMRAIEVSR